MFFVENNKAMDQNTLPLWEQMKKHVESDKIRLHVPGHGGGKGLPPELEEIAQLACYDLTELEGLDDLYHPTGIIREAERLAAELWQATRSYFLVNGSTAGVLAMILATCGPGDTLLIPRNAHISVFHGLILSGATPRYLPVTETGNGFALNVTVETVRAGLAQNPEVKALLLTSPSYYGVCVDTEDVAAATFEHGALLLLDEAHGAHLGFSPGFPSPGGIPDLRVQSWHKTLGAFTPGGVLHLYGNRVDPDRVQTALQWVQTSSPPYPVLLSLDAARKQLAVNGRRLLAQLCEAADDLRVLLRPEFPLLEEEEIRELGFTLDPARITVFTGRKGINGIHAGRFLAAAGINVELALPGHLLAVLGIGYSRQNNEKVARAFHQLPVEAPFFPDRFLPGIPEVVITPREAALAPSCPVFLKEAVGRVAAGMVVPFPPGIPVLAPGERVTECIVEYLADIHEAGVGIRGLDSLCRLRICK